MIFILVNAIILEQGATEMADKFNLDPVAIVEKKFGIDFKGYDPTEVDHMLDLVIEDYQTYQDLVDTLRKKADDLEKTNALLRAKLIELEGRERAKSEDGDPMAQGASNIDILKRLTRLENQVFNSKENKH